MKGKLKYLVIGANIVLTIVTSLFILFKSNNKSEVDLYFAASTIMTFLLTSFNSVIPSVFSPYFNLGAGKKELANIVFVITILLVVPIILINITSDFFGEFIFPNYYNSNKELFNNVFRISNLTFFFTINSVIFNNYLVSRNKILIYEKSLTISGICLIIILLFIKQK